MMNRVTFFRTIHYLPLLVAFLAEGCYKPAEVLRQENWKDKLRQASGLVTTFEENRVPLFSTEQLTSIVGQPDYMVTPREFEMLIRADDMPSSSANCWREYAMRETWKRYRYLKKDEAGASTIRYADSWRKSPEFNKCLLWVYDEAKHFEEPLRVSLLEEWLCCKPGFVVRVFFVENSFCIGDVIFETIESEPPLLNAGE